MGDIVWNVLAFESTHAAMAAQKILGELKPYVIPTPKVITANCGMSLRMGDAEAEKAREILSSHPDIEARCAWYRV